MGLVRCSQTTGTNMIVPPRKMLTQRKHVCIVLHSLVLVGLVLGSDRFITFYIFLYFPTQVSMIFKE